MRALAATIGLLLASCAEGRSDVRAPEPAAELALPVEAPPPDPYGAFLSEDVPFADGFDAPFAGSGWERCGDGCATRARPAAIAAIADALVEPSTEGALRLRHRWLENDRVRELVSVWEGLEADLPAGARVRRGELLGRSSALRVRLEPAEPSVEGFLAARPTLFAPPDEPALALVSHDLLQMRIYRDGVETGRHAISLGQEAGAKERRGDNRTPKGTYFVTQRSRGPFGGDYADYYGGIWLRLNYPNAWDAARGVDQGLITVAQQRSISRAWRARATTARDTRLGSGIGLHAWIEEWADEGPRYLSWGCLVVHVADRDRIYDALPEGSMVVLF